MLILKPVRSCGPDEWVERKLDCHHEVCGNQTLDLCWSNDPVALKLNFMLYVPHHLRKALGYVIQPYSLDKHPLNIFCHTHTERTSVFCWIVCWAFIWYIGDNGKAPFPSLFKSQMNVLFLKWLLVYLIDWTQNCLLYCVFGSQRWIAQSFKDLFLNLVYKNGSKMSTFLLLVLHRSSLCQRQTTIPVSMTWDVCEWAQRSLHTHTHFRFLSRFVVQVEDRPHLFRLRLRVIQMSCMDPAVS